MSGSLEIPSEIDLAEFIAREAHDLKSPFNRVMGFIKLVLKGMDGPISDQAQADLTTAYQNSLYALAMLSGLVEIARLECGERTPIPAPCQVDLLVPQLIVDWKRMFPKETPVEVRSTLPAVTLHVDEMLLRLCLSGWMSYVAEFVQGSGDGVQGPGVIKVEIQVEDRGHTCEFQVRSLGQKRDRPPECDLTLYGYVAQRLVALTGGYLQQLIEDEQGARVRFSLTKGSGGTL